MRLRFTFMLKMMLALACTVLLAVGAVAITVNLSVAKRFEDYVSIERQPRVLLVVPELAAYYASHGGWEGVGPLLVEAGAPGRGRGLGRGAGGAMALVLADGQGQVVADLSGQYQGQELSPRVLEGALPVQVADRTVGYLLAANGPREQEFSARLNSSIWVAGAVASSVAILLGLLLTRTVLKPLRVVRDAAQRIGTGDFAYRVPVTSRDEVGDVALQFNEMAAALERDEQLRRAMMADVAHELRTPLSVMRGQIEALQDGVFELSPENIAPLHEQVVLLGRLVEDLRDLALAEAGRLPLERAEVALDELVPRVAAAFQPQVRDKGLSLSVELPTTSFPRPVVLADPQRLGQVLGNLLSNALRYTPAGGSVTVRLAVKDGRAVLEVADSGVGITAEDLPRVFDRFYRADRARSRNDGGSGLGLTIARQIVEAHGGHITAWSEPGKGSTFTVSLPLVCGT